MTIQVQVIDYYQKTLEQNPSAKIPMNNVCSLLNIDAAKLDDLFKNYGIKKTVKGNNSFVSLKTILDLKKSQMGDNEVIIPENPKLNKTISLTAARNLIQANWSKTKQLLEEKGVVFPPHSYRLKIPYDKVVEIQNDLQKDIATSQLIDEFNIKENELKKMLNYLNISCFLKKDNLRYITLESYNLLKSSLSTRTKVTQNERIPERPLKKRKPDTMGEENLSSSTPFGNEPVLNSLETDFVNKNYFLMDFLQEDTQTSPSYSVNEPAVDPFSTDSFFEPTDHEITEFFEN